MRRRKLRFQETVTDFAITLLILLSAFNVLPILPHVRGPLTKFGRDYSFFSMNAVLLHHVLSAVIGLTLLFISYRLFRRMRMAWTITICLIPISALLHSASAGGLLHPVSVLEIVLEIVFALDYREFRREADPITLRWGAFFALVSIVFVVVFTAASLFSQRWHFHGIGTLRDAFVNSLQMLFMMNPDAVEPRTRFGLMIAHTSIFLYWSSILAALFFILKPLIYQPLVSNRDRQRVQELLEKYGFNPISYVDIEPDKKYYFGVSAEGFVAYVTAGSVAVCAGDPICAPEHSAQLVSEFVVFCREHGYDLCFCQISEAFVTVFRSLGFGVAKYGEEAMFDLTNYTLQGKATAKIRQNIRHAAKQGVEVREYRPDLGRDRSVEEGIAAVSKSWLKAKKSGELSFLLGSVALENPLGRRYFYATNGQGEVCAFIVFVPFIGGYYTDVTRRHPDAPLGCMEKIVITAFEQMKSEDYKWGSLGLAPLYNVTEESPGTPLVRGLLAYVFEHMNSFYGFKALYQYKRKYAPTRWEPRYMSYYPAIFTPKIAYAIVKAQNRGGVRDFLFNRVRHLLARLSDTLRQKKSAAEQG